MRHMICSFVLTLCKNFPFINNKLFAKVLQYYGNGCSQSVQRFSIKNSFIKKSKGQSKNKECKKHYHSPRKVFQICISIVYDSFILQLGINTISTSTALLLWKFCKIRTSFKTLVSKKTAIWPVKKSHCNDKILEKKRFPVITWNKNIHWSKLYL